MIAALVVVAIVVVLAVAQGRRRGSRLQRADNAPVGRLRDGTGDPEPDGASDDGR